MITYEMAREEREIERLSKERDTLAKELTLRLAEITKLETSINQLTAARERASLTPRQAVNILEDLLDKALKEERGIDAIALQIGINALKK